MTTVAVSKKEIAADRQAGHSSGFKFKIKTKLQHFEGRSDGYGHPEAYVVGYAGNLDNAIDILDYLAHPDKYARPPANKGSEFVALTESGKIYTFVNPRKWLLVDEPYYAIGSGSTFALAAMASGKSPTEAVKIANKYDPNTGSSVHTISLSK